MQINRILTNVDREYYKKLIEKMFELCPETMSRKIPDANVQQAFMLDTVGKELKTKSGGTLLCVGSFEDTASECLEKLGTFITNIDPAINFDLHTYTKIVKGEYNQSYLDKYDIIFSTSVIEHVQDDEEFLTDICTLLEHDGTGILTVDFKDDYEIGDVLPATCIRFYTKYDLETRLSNILTSNNCQLVDKPDWSAKPDFKMEDFIYSFATFVFRKNK